MTSYARKWTAPRWVKLEKTIKDLAFDFGLELETEVDKGWVYESGRFTVSGSVTDVLRFIDLFNNKAEPYVKKLGLV